MQYFYCRAVLQIEVLLLRVIFSSNAQYLLLSIPQTCTTYPWVVLYSTSTFRWAGSHPVTDTTKKAKEPSKELVTYAMKKARMTSSQCIKCGDPNHIKKDCTNAWKPTKEEKKKPDKGKDKAAKLSAIMAIVDVVPKPITYSRHQQQWNLRQGLRKLLKLFCNTPVPDTTFLP